jgi:DNA polymerase I-like protein with 3'-5' exonuclease and polymerase domains
MGEVSLARRIGQPVAFARELLHLHRESYRHFWRWSDGVVNHAMLYGEIYTVFGWTLRAGSNANARSLGNFPMQANGAEMLRLACCYATERGVSLCAPVHDAILIEAPVADLDKAVQAAQQAMADASDAVLGFRLRTDVKVIRSPDRYADERGVTMWRTVWDLIEEQQSQPVEGCIRDVCVSATDSSSLDL